MSDNVSKGAQHLTELDFDISRIPQQLEEIEKLVENKTKSIQEVLNKNLKIGDIMNAGDLSKPFTSANKEVLEMRRTLEQLEAKVKALSRTELSANAQKARLKEQAYAIDKKGYSLLLKMAGQGVGSKNIEYEKVELLRQQSKELVNQLKIKGDLTEKEKAQLDIIKEQIREMEHKADTGEYKDEVLNKGQSVWEKGKNFFTYRAFGYAERAAREALSVVKDVEFQMMETSRLVDEVGFSLDSYRDRLFGLAKDYGRDFDETADIAHKFVQAGYSVADSLHMTKDALLALNTAELDSSQATQSMIGIMQQWGMEATELINVIDKINMTADQNALSSQDLVDGLLRSGGAAKTAKMSFDETVGAITAMREATGRTGKEVGNALNSIISYTQRAGSLNIFESMGIKVFADEAKTQMMPVLEIWSQLSNKFKESESLGSAATNAFMESATQAGLMSEELAIATDTVDEYKLALQATTDAAQEFTDVEKRDAAQASAGVHRRNYFIALMENLGKATQVTTNLQDAQGYSARENAKYMDTLTAKLNELVTSLKDLAVQLGEAGALDMAKSITETASAVANLTKNAGGLKTVLMLVLGVILMLKKDKWANSIIDTGKAIGLSIPKLRNYILGLEGVDRQQKATAASATALGASINAALGFIGLAIAAFSLISGAVSTYKAKQEELRQETYEQADATNQQVEALSKLTEEYEKIASKVSRTSDDKERLKEIQEELINTFDLEAQGIDLANGKYEEQLSILRELNENERERARRAAQAAHNEINREVMRAGAKIPHKSVKVKGLSAEQQNLYDDAYRRNADNLLTADPKKELQANIDILRERLKFLEEYGLEEQKAYTQLNANLEYYEEIMERYNHSTQSLLHLEINAEIPKTAEEYKGLIDVIREATEENEQHREKLLDLAKNAYPELHKQTRITESELRKMHEEQGKAIGNLSGVERATKVYENALANANQRQQEFNDNLEENSKKTKEAEENISTLNGVMQTLSEGQTLTADTVIKLIEKYPELTSEIKKTTDGYILEEGALKKLRDKEIERAVETRKEQIEITKEIISASAQRIGKYSEEIKSILTMADAQKILLQATKDVEDVDRRIKEQYRNMHQADASEKMKALMAEKDGIRDVAAEIEGLAGKYADLELFQNNLYKDTGKSSSSSSGGRKTNQTTNAYKNLNKELDKYLKKLEHERAIGKYEGNELAYIKKLEYAYKNLAKTTEEKWSLEEKIYAAKKALEGTGKTLADITKKFEHFNSMGLFTVKEQIKYYNDLLKKIKMSLDEEMSIRIKLHSLHKQQIQEQISLAEKQKNNQIKAIESRYDKEIKRLQDLMDKRNASEEKEDYNQKRKELLDEKRYWEARTGREAVENIEKVNKEIAELDKNWQRKQADEKTKAEIERLENSKRTEIEKLEEKWDRILEIFNDGNLDLIASAGQHLPNLYKQFQNFLVNPLKKDFSELQRLANQLSGVQAKSGATSAKSVSTTSSSKSSTSTTKTTSSSSSASKTTTPPKKGDKIKLSNAPLYAASTDKKGVTNKTGTFYMYDGKKVNKKYRITNAASRVGKTPIGTNVTGWVDEKDIVKARTGGETRGDGMVMLHKNEFIANPSLTTDLKALTDNKIIKGMKAIFNPKYLSGFKQMLNHYTNTYSNNYNNIYNNRAGASVVYNYNAPLQNIEKQEVRDRTDLDYGLQQLERKIMKNVNNTI